MNIGVQLLLKEVIAFRKHSGEADELVGHNTVGSLVGVIVSSILESKRKLKGKRKNITKLVRWYLFESTFSVIIFKRFIMSL